MRLTGIAWRGYSLPFRGVFAAHGTQTALRWGMITLLRSDEGLVGCGEASPVGTGSEADLQSIDSVFRRTAPGLLGRDISPDEIASANGLPANVRFGLETALLDLEGQMLGRPVTTLFGGRPKPVTVNALIAADSPERAAVETKLALEQGFSTIKVKVGQAGADLDEALVAAVRVAAGQGVKLRLDPNQAWDVQRAIEAARRLSRYGIEYIEQPVVASDVEGLAAVRRASAVPIAADEALISPSDLRRLLDADAADVFIIKAARLGGIGPALTMARAVLLAGKQVVVTSSLESGVGIAAGLHLAAALPFQSLAHGLATGSLFTDDLISPRLPVQKGQIATPSTPGLGVKVDSTLLRKYGCGISGSAGSPIVLD